jgi:hypothetical protein
MSVRRSRAGFKVVTLTVNAASTAYIPDADIPRVGAAIFCDDGNTGAGMLMWYRLGTFNNANGPSGLTGTSGRYEYRGATLSGGTGGDFSWFIEGNSAGHRLGVKANAGYGRTFTLFIFGPTTAL